MKTKNDFKNLLSGVAITALLSRKIDSFKKLSNYTEYEISALVGIGPSSIKLLKKGLAENKLSFKKNDSNFKISNSVEQYIAQFPEDLQKILMKIRAIILKEAKGSIELISYGIPAYKYDNKPLIYFALIRAISVCMQLHPDILHFAKNYLNTNKVKVLYNFYSMNLFLMTL